MDEQGFGAHQSSLGQTRWCRCPGCPCWCYRVNETPGGQNEDQEGKGVGGVCEDPIIGEGSRSIHSGRGVPGGQGTSSLVVRCKESALQCRYLICGQSTKISRAVEHLSPHALVLQSWHATRRECVGHSERSHVAVTKIPSPTTKPNKQIKLKSLIIFIVRNEPCSHFMHFHLYQIHVRNTHSFPSDWDIDCLYV